MSADLHIHILKEPCSHEDILIHDSPIHSYGLEPNKVTLEYPIHPLHQNIFNTDLELARKIELTEKEFDEIRRRVWNTPGVWVGEVSWLKASLFDSPDHYIPFVVHNVQEMFMDETSITGFKTRTIDNDMIREITDIYNKCESHFIKLPKTVQKLIIEGNRRDKISYPYRYKWDRNSHIDTTRYRVNRKKHIIDFLIKYIGYEVFTISW